MDCMGNLALMKGRIRLSCLPLFNTFLDTQPRTCVRPSKRAFLGHTFEIVANALDILRNRKTIAIIDQFAIRGGELMIGYAILSSNQRRIGGFHSGFPEIPSYDPSLDLRGRGRGGQLVVECQRLIDTIDRHSARCEMVFPSDITCTDQSSHRQLTLWASELQPALERLGNVFFPAEILNEFRAYAVEHVVLCIDPHFARVPYTALVGVYGSIIDEPWSLSLITASTELIRILERHSTQVQTARSLWWLGPDQDVNENRGGNTELDRLCDIAEVESRIGNAASLLEMQSALSSGTWCHFRGHGRWTGSVSTSGPVLAMGEVLSSEKYNHIAASSSFLFTAACLTGFGEVIGTEVIGALIDYDRAGLIGAVLTNWPIHGDAATVFTTKFYERLKQCDDAATSLKYASYETRSILPHPYFWAPFSLLGGWSVGSMIRWK